MQIFYIYIIVLGTSLHVLMSFTISITTRSEIIYAKKNVLCPRCSLWLHAPARLGQPPRDHDQPPMSSKTCDAEIGINNHEHFNPSIGYMIQKEYFA